MNIRYLACLLILVGAPAVALGVPEIFVTDVEFLPTVVVSLLGIPDGSGPGFDGARTIEGETVDASIGFTIIDRFGDPIATFPYEDMYLRFADAVARHCGGYPVILADGDSDPEGRVRFSHPFRGGGWCDEPLVLEIAGAPAYYPGWIPVDPFLVYLNSPDLSGDGEVDLTDIVMFASDLGEGTAFRSDLVWDGVINLSDIVLFTQHLGAHCD